MQVCYRRSGHSESDDPKFTQPHMHQKIKRHPRSLEIYKGKLLEEGLVSEEEFQVNVA